MTDATVTQADRDAYDALMCDELYDHPPHAALYFARHRRSATASLIAALEEAREALEVLGLRELVAGWNGENREDGPYEPHPPKLGVTLRTNAGAVYKLDAALTRITAELAKHKGAEDA